MNNRFWQCECCCSLIVTAPQDSAVNYPCPQCTITKCDHGGKYQEIDRGKFICEAFGREARIR